MNDDQKDPTLKSRVMAWVRVSVAAICCAQLVACTSPSLSGPVVVPEAIFRTEATIANRIKLPLNAADRAQLEAFLSSGGNRNNRSGTPELQLVRDAARVLDWLASTPLTIETMTQGKHPDATAYFGAESTRQIIDARNHDPRHYVSANGDMTFAAFPIAYTHERFNWIFYPDEDGKIVGLMVVQDITRTKPKE